MREIWIIGTEPPCPRCALMFDRVAEVVRRHGIDARVEHFAFDSNEASELGHSEGRRIGTAKHVAHDLGLPIDIEAIGRLIERRRQMIAAARGVELAAIPIADTWTQELDDALLPFYEEACENQYLMTPILVIDGRVVYHGSVLSLEELERLIAR